jgi:hypothetical protein
MGVRLCFLGSVGCKIAMDKGCSWMWWEIDDCSMQGT